MQPQKKAFIKSAQVKKMIVIFIALVFASLCLCTYLYITMIGDSVYYTLYKRYDKSVGYVDEEHGIVVHSRTHKPLTGVIIIEDSGILKNSSDSDMNPHTTQKEIFIKNGQIRGEKIYDKTTNKLCIETFFDYEGLFKYRRSYGANCNFLEKEEIFKKDKDLVLFYNAQGEKTIRAYLKDGSFTHGQCYESFWRTTPLNQSQLERLNKWDSSISCRD